MAWLRGGVGSDPKGLVGQLRDPSKRERAKQELLKLGAAAAPALADSLGIQDEELSGIYEQLLTAFGADATPALIETLSEAHPLARARAAEVLAQTRDHRAFPALMDALRGEYYTVRTQAALALGQIKDPAAVPDLKRATMDAEPQVRSAAAQALAQFADPDTFEEIGNLLLDDPQIEVRQAAARAFGRTQRTEAVPFLMDALRDSFWWYEREDALQDLLDAITDIGKPAIPELIEALQDSEGTVRKLAASLLARLPDSRTLEPLSLSLYDTHFDVCRASAEALAALGRPALPVLREALHHPEAWIRQQAVAGLTKLHGPDAAMDLLELIQDENEQVRKQVVRALGELRDPRALPALETLAASRGNREFSQSAKQAIHEIKNG